MIAALLSTEAVSKAVQKPAQKSAQRCALLSPALAAREYEYQRVLVTRPDGKKTTVSFEWDFYFEVMSKLKVRSIKSANKEIRLVAERLLSAGHDGTLSSAIRAVLKAELLG